MILCLDLKEREHNQYWIQHLTDTSTKYSAAKLIKTKSEEVIYNICGYLILDLLRVFWVTIGKNFNNLNRWMKNWILKHALQLWKVHSAMVQWNHRLIVAEAMEKLLEDEKYKPEIALALTIFAKNDLQNHLGHSLNELVFVFNINISSILKLHQWDWKNKFKCITYSEEKLHRN